MPARRPPDLERRRTFRLGDVVEFGEIEAGDPLRLQHDAQALLHRVVENLLGVAREHSAEKFPVDLHFEKHVVVAPGSARFRAVFVEDEIDARDAADLHASEFDRRTDVDALHGAVHVGLEENFWSHHAVGAEVNERGRKQKECRYNEHPDFEVVGLPDHGITRRSAPFHDGRKPAHSRWSDGRAIPSDHPPRRCPRRPA